MIDLFFFIRTIVPQVSSRPVHYVIYSKHINFTAFFIGYTIISIICNVLQYYFWG